MIGTAASRLGISENSEETCQQVRTPPDVFFFVLKLNIPTYVTRNHARPREPIISYFNDPKRSANPDNFDCHSEDSAITIILFGIEEPRTKAAHLHFFENSFFCGTQQILTRRTSERRIKLRTQIPTFWSTFEIAQAHRRQAR